MRDGVVVGSEEEDIFRAVVVSEFLVDRKARVVSKGFFRAREERTRKSMR